MPTTKSAPEKQSSTAPKAKKSAKSSKAATLAALLADRELRAVIRAADKIARIPRAERTAEQQREWARGRSAERRARVAAGVGLKPRAERGASLAQVA